MDKCTRCNKPIQNWAVVTITKLVCKSRLERSYRLCGYCVEELEEFLMEKKEESNE